MGGLCSNNNASCAPLSPLVPPIVENRCFTEHFTDTVPHSTQNNGYERDVPAVYLRRAFRDTVWAAGRRDRTERIASEVREDTVWAR